MKTWALCTMVRNCNSQQCWHASRTPDRQTRRNSKRTPAGDCCTVYPSRLHGFVSHSADVVLERFGPEPRIFDLDSVDDIGATEPDSRFPGRWPAAFIQAAMPTTVVYVTSVRLLACSKVRHKHRLCCRHRSACLHPDCGFR